MDEVKLIPNFPNYVFDFSKMVVINKRRKKALRPRKRGGKKYFKLYRDGCSREFSLFEILCFVFNK